EAIACCLVLDGSKQKLQRELELARIERARNPSKIGGEGRTTRNVEVGMIQQIVCFSAKLEFHRFSQGQVLLQRQVDFLHPRSADGVSRSIPKRVERRQ